MTVVSRVAIGVVAACVALCVSRPLAAAAAGRPVTFPSEDGATISAMLYEAHARPAGAVVLVHMLGRSKDDFASLADQLQSAGTTALAIDLRGHGSSGGAATPLPAMTKDVRAAVQWLAARPATRPGAIAVVGASLGANLALIASLDVPTVRAVALLSPSLDYRGVRIDAAMMKRLAGRAAWLAASTEDPYALRTLKELSGQADAAAVQRLSTATAHGTNLLAADPDLTRDLVSWLRDQLSR